MTLDAPEAPSADARPIPFSSPMVREILAGRKTQTRRVIPIDDRPILSAEVERGFPGYLRRGMPSNAVDVRGALPYMKCAAPPGSATVSARVRPPYEPGDRLWVKEPLRPRMTDGASGYSSEREVVVYEADGATAPLGAPVRDWPWRARCIGARYCPRWASRLTLRVTGVRVERIQSISVDDAIAEGIRGHRETTYDGPGGYYVIDDFRTLWDSINAKRGYGWDANPWVWAITFEPIVEPG